MIDVTFSDGHHEQVSNMIEWLDFLSETDSFKTNFYEALDKAEYQTALDELSGLDSDVAARVSIIISIALENDIDSLVFS